MVHPQGNGIAQNTKYEEMTNTWYLCKLEIRKKRRKNEKVVIIPKLKKGLKTTPNKIGSL